MLRASYRRVAKPELGKRLNESRLRMGAQRTLSTSLLYSLNFYLHHNEPCHSYLTLPTHLSEDPSEHWWLHRPGNKSRPSKCGTCQKGSQKPKSTVRREK